MKKKKRRTSKRHARPAERPASEERVELDMERITASGEGVAHDASGRVVFVQGALPGERALVRLTQQKKRFAKGVAKRLLSKPSELRVEPPCPVGHRCGGCDLQHVEFWAQGELKAQAILENMRRVCRDEALELDAWHPAPSLGGWRVRATVRAHRMADGTLKLGMLERGSHMVVDIDRCMVLAPPLQEAMLILRELCEACDVTRLECFMELATPSGEVVWSIQRLKLGKRKRGVQELFSRAVDEHELLRGVQWHNRLQHDESLHLSAVGRCSVHASLALSHCPEGLREEELPAGLFRQAHHELSSLLSERAVDLVRQALKEGTTDSERSHVLELFSGSGNFTFAFLKGCSVLSHLTALEVDPAAVRMARRLSDKLDVPHAHIEHRVADLFDDVVVDALMDEVAEREGSTVLFLDPPRAGAKAVCTSIVARGAENLRGIVYVACDAMTLARDMAELRKGGWRVVRLEMIDMFPGTAHVESIARLQRR